MKVKLLRKCRESIVILNNYGQPPQSGDKKIMLIKWYGTKYTSFKNFRGGIYFSSKDSIISRRREEILNLAHEFSNTLWYKILNFKWKRL